MERTLFGVAGTDHRAIDLAVKPCIPEKMTPYNKHLKDEKCIADYSDPKKLKEKLQESIEYLGRPQIYIVSNHERLDLS
jgi:hypothetical protein